MLPANKKDNSQPAKKGAFSRALERLRNNSVAHAEDNKAAAHQAAATAVARNHEFFIVQRCAVTGERFKTLFTRRADGKFVAKAQMKIEEQFSEFVCDDGTGAYSSNIRAEDIVHMPDGPCPCCGRRLDYQHVRCSKCNELVCTGRSYEDEHGFMFVCHSGCGSRGSLSGERIASYTAEPMEAPPVKPALTQEKRPALPSGKTKLLGRR
ncbi:Zn finger protein HypA/HybF involved in hydrogenase expression [Bradyrhizobium liaoningense]